jgi:hypothetical protein
MHWQEQKAEMSFRLIAELAAALLIVLCLYEETCLSSKGVHLAKFFLKSVSAEKIEGYLG